jgi:peptidoglycan/LPS O-acetylase OafA/YrhL
MTNKRRDCNLTKRIVELDGLRGIAVLLILYYHYAPSLLCRLDQAHPGEWPVLKYIWYSHRLTWSAVDLFFVLSGFLIVGILIDMKDSKFYFKTFYIRRICRIFPLYYLMVLLYIINHC